MQKTLAEAQVLSWAVSFHRAETEEQSIHREGRLLMAVEVLLEERIKNKKRLRRVRKKLGIKK
jgi:hypothetical protein